MPELRLLSLQKMDEEPSERFVPFWLQVNTNGSYAVNTGNGGNWLLGRPEPTKTAPAAWKIAFAAGLTLVIVVIIIVTLVKLCKACKSQSNLPVHHVTNSPNDRQVSTGAATQTEVIYEDYDNTYVGMAQPLLQDSTVL